ARLAERGKLDAIFLADGQAATNVSDSPRWFLEPITTLTALSRATERIGLICTISSTFFTPFHAARLMASLHHISKGRAGWDGVESMFDAEARRRGDEAMPADAERYARAAEFIGVVLKLCGSWVDDARPPDRSGDYVRKDAVRQVLHHGEHCL